MIDVIYFCSGERHPDITNKSPVPMNPNDKARNSDIDFRLVPQDLMPVNPIETVPNSVQMYEHHMEVSICIRKYYVAAWPSERNFVMPLNP